MINQESKLKLQAYLDNELSSVESRQMTAWLDQDAAALALYTALRDVKLVLARNELEEGVPKVGRGIIDFIGLFRDFAKCELGVAFRSSRPIPCQLQREQRLERIIRWRSFQ